MPGGIPGGINGKGRVDAGRPETTAEIANGQPAMRKLLDYAAVTLLLGVGIFCALLYIRSGDMPPAPAWSGGEIRVGYSSEPPYSFRTPDGNVTGEGPEVAKAVLARIGVERIRWVLFDFSKAITALQAGQVDMIANGLFITPERTAQVLFSLPYCAVQQGLLVRRGNPFGLDSYEAVAAHPKVIAAVLDGSVEQQTLVRLGVPEDRLFVAPDPAGGLAAVRSGRADCLALSGPTVRWLAGEGGGDVDPVEEFISPQNIPVGQSAFAFRRGDVRLAGAVDAVLRGYIGTPEHLARVEPLGFGTGTLPEWSKTR